MRTLEFCYECGNATGNAGRMEDSLYIVLPNGEELGPLCEECYNDQIESENGYE